MSLVPIIHHPHGPTTTSCLIMILLRVCSPISCLQYFVLWSLQSCISCSSPWCSLGSVLVGKKGLRGGESSLLHIQGSPETVGTIPLLLPTPPRTTGHTVGDPRSPHGPQGPMCPSGPTPHSISPVVSPREPLGTSAHHWSLQCHVCPMEMYTTPRANPASTHQLAAGSRAAKKRGRDRI